MPYPLPRHQLSKGDTVLIRHDVGTGGFHEEVREEVVGEGIVRAVDAYCTTVEVDKNIKGKSLETLLWLGRTEVKAEVLCYLATVEPPLVYCGGTLRSIGYFVLGKLIERSLGSGCILYACCAMLLGVRICTHVENALVTLQDSCCGCSDPATTKQQPHKRDNDVEVLTDEGMAGTKHITKKARFSLRDIDCIRQLKMHQLEEKELPDHHVLALYRYMDISRCRLCTSICDTLEAMNQYWITYDLFNSLVHVFKCGITSECKANTTKGSSAKGNSTKGRTDMIHALGHTHKAWNLTET